MTRFVLCKVISIGKIDDGFESNTLDNGGFTSYFPIVAQKDEVLKSWASRRDRKGCKATYQLFVLGCHKRLGMARHY